MICCSINFVKVIGAYKKVSKRNDKQNLLNEYLNTSQAKIVVKVNNEEDLIQLQNKAKFKKVNYFMVENEN